MIGSTFRNDLLKLTYNATAIANVADNAATAPLTNISVSLHTADPGSGTQATSEVAYTGYARVSVARTSGGWTVTANSVSPAANIDFGQRTDNGAAQVVTHWSTGVTGGGATKIFDRGVIGAIAGPMTGATSDTITIPGHTLIVDDRVAFYATAGSTLPTGITEGTVYWVKTVATDTVTISTTQGGATLDITASGDGIAYKISPITVNQNSIPRLTTATAITIE